jgi:AraC-like DNA-binding protein
VLRPLDPSAIAASTAVSASPAQVHPIYARLLRVLLEQAGADGDRVLAAAGIDPAALMTDDRRIGIETVVRGVEMAIAATGRPWLGLDLGGQAPVSAHGSVGYAVVTARDLGDALRTLARFFSLRSDVFVWRFDDGPDGAALVLTERVPLGAARGFVLDATVAAALRVLEAAIGPLPAGLRIDLPFAAPPWADEYRRFGAALLRFGTRELRIAADTRTMARPCLGADARAHESACRACEEALAELDGGRLAPRVAAMLASAGATELPAMTRVASQCGVSPRTLMRRLKAEGTSYQQLLDEMRQARARWLLEHTAHSIEEIAEALGYVDTSNFSRTVRRWFGCTPRAVREGAKRDDRHG